MLSNAVDWRLSVQTQGPVGVHFIFKSQHSLILYLDLFTCLYTQAEEKKLLHIIICPLADKILLKSQIT